MSETRSRLVFGLMAGVSMLGIWATWRLDWASGVLGFLLGGLAPAGVVVFGLLTLYPPVLRQLEKDLA